MTTRNRPIKGLHGQALRDFRHLVSKAKKKGLVSKRIDARKQKPTRYMRAKMASLSAVFEGTSVGVKVAPKMAREYKQAGFQVVNNHVVVAADPGEIAGVRSGRPLLRRKLGPGIWEERIVLPITPMSLQQIVDDAAVNQAKYDALKEPDEVFAFKLFGRNSLASFEDFGLLIDYLARYQVFETHDNPETWESIDFYRVVWGKWQESPRERRKRMKTEQDRRQAVRHLKPTHIRKSEAAEYKRRYRALNPEWRKAEAERDRLAQAKRRALARQAKADRGE